MKATFGFLLIGLGLTFIYISLGGTFAGASAAKPLTPEQAHTVVTPERVTGGAIPPMNVPDLTPRVTFSSPAGHSYGSGSVSWNARLVHFGGLN